MRQKFEATALRFARPVGDSDADCRIAGRARFRIIIILNAQADSVSTTRIIEPTIGELQFMRTDNKTLVFKLIQRLRLRERLRLADRFSPAEQRNRTGCTPGRTREMARKSSVN